MAAQLGYGETTVRKLVDAGRLPVVRIVPNGRLRFRLRDVERLVENGLTAKEKKT